MLYFIQYMHATINVICLNNILPSRKDETSGKAKVVFWQKSYVVQWYSVSSSSRIHPRCIISIDINDFSNVTYIICYIRMHLVRSTAKTNCYYNIKNNSTIVWRQFNIISLYSITCNLKGCTYGSGRCVKIFENKRVVR